MTPEIHPFHQLFISLALGLLVGLQRQWVGAPLGGIRTFALISVFGTLCAFIAKSFGAWILVGGLFGVISVMLVGNFSHKIVYDAEKHSPLSTEVAMLVMFAIGVLSGIGPLWLAATAAGVLVVVLQLKIELHGFAGRFTDKEIRAFIQFVLISLVILPVVPDRTIGPLNVLNPHEIWLMVLLIVGISLTGYVIYKLFGDRAGTWMSGILGGLISSTATTTSYGKRCKDRPEAVSQGAVVISLAWTIAYIRLMAEVSVAAPSFRTVYLPLSVLASVSFLGTFLLWHGNGKRSEPMPSQENPSELKTALVFGFLFAAIQFGSAAAKHYLGSRGLLAAAFLSGVTDLDAITLSTSRLVHSGTLFMDEGNRVILVAVLSNLLFKGAVAFVLGGRSLFKAIGITLAVSILTIGLFLIVGTMN